MRSDILVDVIIPVRNGQSHIRFAVESVVKQTMPRFRIVVVDNFSTDQTAAIVRSITDPRIELIQPPQSLTLFQNFNYCLSQVRAPYFCLLHGDDCMLERYLERMTSALAAEPGAVLAACQVETMDAEGAAYPNLKYRLKNVLFLNRRKLLQAHSVSGRVLRAFNFLTAPSLIYRREALDRIGVFRESFAFFSDFEYIDRGLRNQCAYLVVPEVLFRYRLHASQETSSLTRSLFKYQETRDYFTERVVGLGGKASSRFGFVGGEARIALVMVWDYMQSAPEAVDFRRKLGRYLAETSHLRWLKPCWWMLGQMASAPGFLRVGFCASLLALLLLPMIGWELARR